MQLTVGIVFYLLPTLFNLGALLLHKVKGVSEFPQVENSRSRSWLLYVWPTDIQWVPSTTHWATFRQEGSQAYTAHALIVCKHGSVLHNLGSSDEQAQQHTRVPPMIMSMRTQNLISQIASNVVHWLQFISLVFPPHSAGSITSF